MVKCGALINDEHHDHDHGRDRKNDSETAAVLGAEIVDPADGKSIADRGEDNVFLEQRNAEVAQRRPTAQCRGDSQIGDEQQRADDREQAPLRASR